MKRYPVLIVCAAAVLLGACGKESKLPTATGKGTVRAINAIPASPPLAFLIEERGLGLINYKSATAPAQYDDLSYTFNFEFILAGDTELTRVASQLLDVEADRDYTFVVSGAIDAPTITLWEADVRDWQGTETAFQVRVGHTATTLGSIDVYLADAAIPPAVGQELGTLAYGEVLPPVDLESGSYVLTITAAGDPSTVWFEGNSVILGAQNSFIINVFDGDENNLSPYAARFYLSQGGGASAIVDANYLPTVRFFHTDLAIGPMEIYFGDPPTVPADFNQVFGEFTDDIEVPSDVLPITYTTPDMGMVLFDLEPFVIQGSRTHYYVVRDSDGTDVMVVYTPNRRSVETVASVSIINTATSQPNVDIYTVPTGELIDEASPHILGLPVGVDPIRLTFDEGSFDIYVTVPDEKTVLTGPVPIDLVLGDVFDMIIYENADPNVVDLVTIPIP